MSIAHKIKKDFLSNDLVNYDSKIVGQVCRDNKYYLSDNVGPAKSLEYLLHEICHFAELEPDRLKKYPTNGWGLSSGKFWQIGVHWGYEQRTSQQVDREGRVWAFQLACQREYGMNDSAEDLVSSAVYIPAWCYFSAKHKSNGKHHEKKALYKLAKRVERMSNSDWSYQRLLEDYNQRLDFLKKD